MDTSSILSWLACSLVYGIYFSTCLTEGEYIYDDIYDDLLDDHEVVGVEPAFDVPLHNVTVMEGQTALLPCSIKNLGNNKVAWQKDILILTYEDRRIADDSRLSIKRSVTIEWNLQITDVKYSDQGTYKCTINTSPVRSKAVTLYVKVPPKFDFCSGDVVVQEGETVLLFCNATGVPKPTISWYRVPAENISPQGGGQLKQCEPLTQRPGIGFTGEILMIPNVSRNCDGIYEAKASNWIPNDVSRRMNVTVEWDKQKDEPEEPAISSSTKCTTSIILQTFVTFSFVAILVYMRI